MNASVINRIEVRNLFGFRSYVLPGRDVFSNVAILYGDNGVGKSTILSLVFHLLSPADNRGHRGALLDVPFDYLGVTLNTGEIISAERNLANEGSGGRSAASARLKIERDGKVLALWIFAPGRPEIEHIELDDDSVFWMLNESGQTIQVKRRLPRGRQKKETHNIFVRSSSSSGNQDEYLKVLADIVPVMFFVNAERRLESDSIGDRLNDVTMHHTLKKSGSEGLDDAVNRIRERALEDAMLAASRWVQRRALQSTNQGATNVHSVYMSVLRHLSNNYNENGDVVAPDQIYLIAKKIEEIEKKTAQFSEYELTTRLDMSDFKRALLSPLHEQRALTAKLINPYLDSESSRLGALDGVYDVLDRFVRSINEFLAGKRLKFRMSHGFSVETERGPLSINQLSSGEKQLLLIFFFALVARDKPSVFIIDEPEISLNVKWQRKLVRSLQEVTSGASIQFILASHSMELIAQHRPSVVKLEVA